MSNNGSHAGQETIGAVATSAAPTFSAARSAASRAPAGNTSGSDEASAATVVSRPKTTEELLSSYTMPGVGGNDYSCAGDIPPAAHSRYAQAGQRAAGPGPVPGIGGGFAAAERSVRTPLAALYEPAGGSASFIEKRTRAGRTRVKFDYDRAGIEDMEISADREDRLSDVKAAIVLNSVHAEFGIERSPGYVLKGFDDALFLYVALNQTSFANDAKGEFWVAGDAFEYQRVAKILGPHPRKFFRVYADEIRAVLRRVLSNESKSESASAMAESIRATAHDRGLMRFPDLCFDVADHCSDLSHTERTALKLAAREVINGATNVVDKIAVSRATAVDPDD